MNVTRRKLLGLIAGGVATLSGVRGAKPEEVDWEPLGSNESIDLLVIERYAEAEEFRAYYTAMLRQVSSGMGIPLEMLTSDLDGAGYSSAREATLVLKDRHRRGHR